MALNPRFISRTVLVQNKDVDAACRVLNRIMGKEGMFDRSDNKKYYNIQKRNQIYNLQKSLSSLKESNKRLHLIYIIIINTSSFNINTLIYYYQHINIIVIF